MLWGDGRCLGPSAEEPDCLGGREKVGVGLGRGQGGRRVCAWDPPHGEQARDRVQRSAPFFQPPRFRKVGVGLVLPGECGECGGSSVETARAGMWHLSLSLLAAP